MKKDWAKDFYKMQYEFIGNYGKDFYEVSAVEILSQIGKPIENLVELGSADGSLSRALSNKVSHITTVELVDNLVEKAKEVNPVNINAINGDFLKIDLQNTYDAIIYIDGFGLGDDSAQLNLLKNIKQWLKKCCWNGLLFRGGLIALPARPLVLQSKTSSPDMQEKEKSCGQRSLITPDRQRTGPR